MMDEGLEVSWQSCDGGVGLCMQVFGDGMD